MLLTLLAVALAYLLGSIPWSYLAGKLVKGIDIRTVGSYNAGALNTFQHVGKGYGLAVLGADIGKGALAIMLPDLIGAPEVAMYLAAGAVVAGHNWPVFLGFRGGKGAATVFGISLAVLPVLTVITFAPMLAVIVLTRVVVIGIAVGFVLLNLLTVATGQELPLILLCLILTLFVAVTYLAARGSRLWRAARQRRWKEMFLVE